MKKAEIIKFIKTQISLDIIISRECKKRNIICFEDNLKQNEMCQLLRLSSSSKRFKIETNGHKTLAIIF